MTVAVIAFENKLAEKTCAACQKTLPVTAFGKKRSSKDGRASSCVLCARAYNAEWRRQNPDKIQAVAQRWRKKNPKYAQMWQSQNMALHVKANQKYRDRVALLPKPVETETKECSDCGCVKQLSQFYVTTHFVDGRASKCVSCTMRHKRRKFYGLNEDAFERMWGQQDGCCAICSVTLRPFGKDGCVIDHDHKTGRVRGLLCSPCNVALGHLKDNPLVCEAAALYLRNFQEVPK